MIESKKCTSIFAAMALSLVLGLSSCKDNSNDPKEIAEDENEVKFDQNESREDDSEFLVDAAELDLMEIELGKAAQSKAVNAEVKKFADMMVAGHSKSSNELKATAQRLKISVPETLTQEGQEKLKTLNEKSGKDFDQKYMEMMVDAHQEAVDEFEEASTQANDTELRSWATGKLPDLRAHLEQAKKLRDQLK